MTPAGNGDHRNGGEPESDWRLVFGAYEEATAMIGYRTEVAFAEVAVNWPMAKYYAAALEDGNPSYWDPDYAAAQWGGVISPPGMLWTWMMPVPWRPGGVPPFPGLPPRVPLPGNRMLNASTETVFFRPIRLGDHLNFYDELLDVSPEKTSRVGTGYFVTTCMTYRNQQGDKVATNTNVVFRYESDQ